MTKDKKPQCTKWVFSGARWDTGGHQCPRNALPGETLCRQHYDIANPQPVEAADMNGNPATTEHQGTLRSILRWDAGTGPIIVSCGKRYFVRRLEITLPVYEAKRGRAYLRADCALVKKDGTESLTYTTGDYVNEDQFAMADVAKLIDDKIKNLEIVADVIRQEMEAFSA